MPLASNRATVDFLDKATAMVRDAIREDKSEHWAEALKVRDPGCRADRLSRWCMY